MTGTSISIEGSLIRAASPEGALAELRLQEFFAQATPADTVLRRIVLPNGGRKAIPRGPLIALLHETAPRLTNFKWIAQDSRAAFGEEAQYRNVRLSLPYVIVVAVFQCDRRGNLSLTRSNECFFTNKSLDSLDQPLCFPALLNCSRFEPPDGKPLSWICTQYLQHSARSSRRARSDPNQQLRAELKKLLHCLFETGFNYSSEFNETSSWFSESTKIDKRIATVEAWEAASAEDPLFVLDLPWIPTQLTAEQLVDRIFQNHGVAHSQQITTADDVARIVFNAK